jgi:hypothetical protein
MKSTLTSSSRQGRACETPVASSLPGWLALLLYGFVSGSIALGAAYVAGSVVSLPTGRRTVVGGVVQILVASALVAVAGYSADSVVSHWRRGWIARLGRRS